MAEGRALWQVKPYIVFFPAIFLSSRCWRSTCWATACATRSTRALAQADSERRWPLLEGREPADPLSDAGRRRARGGRRVVPRRCRRDLAIVGESGCGKSVTAMSILRLIQEPPGKIAGRDPLRGHATCWRSPKPRCARSAATRSHDLPGADDQPQSGADRRPADRRDGAAASGLVARRRRASARSRC